MRLGSLGVRKVPDRNTSQTSRQDHLVSGDRGASSMTGGCSRSAGRRPTTPGHLDTVSAWLGEIRTSIALRTWRTRASSSIPAARRRSAISSCCAAIRSRRRAASVESRPEVGAGALKSIHISREQSALPRTSSSVALTGDGATFSITAADAIAMRLGNLRRNSENTFLGWST